MSTEIKVGIVFLVGLLGLAGSTFVVEGISIFEKKGPEYQVYFDQISGLAVGDPVLYGGFEVGKVSRIVVDTDQSLALVSYRIDADKTDFVKIHRDSEHNVGADLFGRTALTITFGTPGAVLVPEAGNITKLEIPKGIKPTEMSQVMNSVGTVIDEAKGLPTEVKKLTISLNENQERVLMEFLGILQENRPNIKSFMEDVADIAASLSGAEGTIGKLIKEDKLYNKTDEIMDKANSIGREVNQLGRQLNEVVGENRRNIKELTDSLAEAGPSLDKGLKTASEMLDENRQNLKKITDDLAEMTVPRINKSLYDLNLITGQVAKGEGLIGEAVMSEEFKKEIDKAVQSVSEAAGEITTFAGGANKLETYLGLDARTAPVIQETQVNLYLRIAPSSRKEYLIGGTFYVNYDEPDPLLGMDWREARFDQMTFTALLGWRFSHDRIAFKVGAIESVVGGVFEYSFFHGSRDLKTGEKTQNSQTTTLRFEMRGIDKDYEDPDDSLLGTSTAIDKVIEQWETELMLRCLVRHNFGNGLMLQVGADNILNTPRFMVGFVFEYRDQDIKYVASL